MKIGKVNGYIIFFWFYCIDGVWVYSDKLYYLFEEYNINQYEDSINGITLLHRYNFWTNLFLLVGLLILVFLLFKKNVFFLKLFLWHTLSLAMINFYNQYLINEIPNIPDEVMYLFQNEMKAYIIVIWLIFWGILIEKYDKGKSYFLNTPS